MIIYNVTIKVDWKIAEEWLKWSREIHLPAMLATGCFTNHQIIRLLEVDDTEGPTYAIQYFANSLGDYKAFAKKHALTLSSQLRKQWGDKCLTFGTLMETIE